MRSWQGFPEGSRSPSLFSGTWPGRTSDKHKSFKMVHTHTHICFFLTCLIHNKDNKNTSFFLPCHHHFKRAYPSDDPDNHKSKVPPILLSPPPPPLCWRQVMNELCLSGGSLVNPTRPLSSYCVLSLSSSTCPCPIAPIFITLCFFHYIIFKPSVYTEIKLLQ